MLEGNKETAAGEVMMEEEWVVGDGWVVDFSEGLNGFLEASLKREQLVRRDMIVL